jgi:hypothetical protein
VVGGAEEHVVALRAVDVVVARAAADDVVAVAGVDVVVAVGADDDVVAVVAVEQCWSVLTRRVQPCVGRRLAVCTTRRWNGADPRLKTAEPTRNPAEMAASAKLRVVCRFI